jgi:hypothetical protein
MVTPNVGTTTIDPRTNLVIVTDLLPVVEAIDRTIKLLDQRTPPPARFVSFVERSRLWYLEVGDQFRREPPPLSPTAPTPQSVPLIACRVPSRPMPDALVPLCPAMAQFELVTMDPPYAATLLHRKTKKLVDWKVGERRTVRALGRDIDVQLARIDPDTLEALFLAPTDQTRGPFRGL